VGAGNILTDAGNSVGGLPGLAAALLGGAIQGMGGAITPEADTRCWKTLPAEYSVYALNLPDGEHEVVFDRYLYFERVDRTVRKFSIVGPTDMAVVFGPPTLMGRYSFGALNDDGQRKVRAGSGDSPAANQPMILLPPPLALPQIERFPADSQTKQPRAFVPDPNRLARLAQQTLQQAGCTGILVDHNRVVTNRAAVVATGPLALQAELLGVSSQEGKKEETFLADFEFTLVNTQSGTNLLKRRLTGNCVKGRKDKTECVTAFNNSFNQALEQLVKSTEFSTVVRGSNNQ
jgi:hypothetical protein